MDLSTRPRCPLTHASPATVLDCRLCDFARLPPAGAPGLSRAASAGTVSLSSVVRRRCTRAGTSRPATAAPQSSSACRGGRGHRRRRMGRDCMGRDCMGRDCMAQLNPRNRELVRQAARPCGAHQAAQLTASRPRELQHPTARGLHTRPRDTPRLPSRHSAHHVPASHPHSTSPHHIPASHPRITSPHHIPASRPRITSPHHLPASRPRITSPHHATCRTGEARSALP